MVRPVQTRPTIDPGRPRRASRPWPWILALASLAVFAIANLLYPSADADPGFTIIFGAIIGAFVFVGALLATRVPANPIGRGIPRLGGVAGDDRRHRDALGPRYSARRRLAGHSRDRGDPQLMSGSPLPSSASWSGSPADLSGRAPAIPAAGGGSSLPSCSASSPTSKRAARARTARNGCGSEPVRGFGPVPAGGDPGRPCLAVHHRVPVRSCRCRSRHRRAGDMERHQLKSLLIAVAVVAAIALPIAFIVPESSPGGGRPGGRARLGDLRASGGDCHRDPALPPGTRSTGSSAARSRGRKGRARWSRTKPSAIGLQAR